MRGYITNSFIGCSLALLLGTTLPAATLVKEHPYKTIVARNVFGLQPFVKQPIQKQPEVILPPLEVLVTGLTDIGGKSQVLLEITEAGKPVRRPILCRGEVMDGIEVLQIEVTAGFVQLRVRGVETVLRLQKKQPAIASAVVR